MGYYNGSAGDYYGGMRGDYYGGNRGDIWKKIKKGAKKLGKVVKQVAPMGAAMMVPGAASFLPAAAGGFSWGNLGRAAASKALDAGIAHLTEKASGGEEYVPAAVNNPIVPDFIEKLWDGTKRKRRTMNAGNAAALRRALRRVDAFRNLAKKSGALPAVRRLPSQRAERCNHK